MKQKIIVACSWLCVVLTMLMIFIFSEENAEKSTQTSSSVIENVLDIVMPKEEITPEVVKKYQFPFRKAAHFGIYMLLGFCLANAFDATIRKKWYFSYPSAIILGAFYAVLDEWHQNFSDGRGPSAKDVLIDSAGIVVGVLIFWGLFSLWKFIKSSKKPIIR